MPDIIKQPEMQQYVKSFASGKTLFLEGDNSQDMYILISGKLEVYKGNKKIAEIIEPGTTAGELSFLFRSKRTASIKTLNDVEVMMIPASQIKDVLHKFPDFAHQITLRLAKRLEETTRIMQGLREFNDQLPDAIIMADKEKNILSWNQTAEKLHGRTWQQMKGYPLADLYQSSQAYERFLADVQSGNSLHEKELAINHPDENKRFVSTSTTVLYDGHHNVEGFIFLSRDMTGIKELEKKYKRIKSWLIPAIALLCITIISLVFTIPYFSRGNRILDYKKEAFEIRIKRDSHNITMALTKPLITGDLKTVTDIFQGFFDVENPEHFGIIGLILLDHNKKIVSAFSPKTDNTESNIIGSSYSGIKFKADQADSYNILTLFRADEEHPMGAKGVEIAYEIRQEDGEVTNWLIFQLEMKHLDREFGINTKVLSKINFMAN